MFYFNDIWQRLPDAARIVMYHRDFYGKPMSVWTHAAMRGHSNWSVGERGLMAAWVAKWSSCPFCVEAHGSVAEIELGDTFVSRALDDFESARNPAKLKITLTFLQNLVHFPKSLSDENIQLVLASKVNLAALEVAIAVATIFSIIARCANDLDFAILNRNESERVAMRMWHKGYGDAGHCFSGPSDHQKLAESLRARILEGPGRTEKYLRQSMADEISADSLQLPFKKLAWQVRNESYGITDQDVQELVDGAESEKAAFELIIAAAVGAGLSVWDRGLRLLKTRGASE